MKKFFTTILIFLAFLLTGQSQTDSLLRDSISTDSTNGKLIVYKYDIKEQIAPPVWRTTQKAFEAASEAKANLMLIHMNTYGGLVDAADSIRTKILGSRIPVYVLIDNNAASAGALISIACDSIYMVEGANIGAATVVDQTGNVVPDKFQSYMRSMMRSTAEANGRDPQIAQAMVDPSIYVPGVSDSGKVLTFTTSEAIRHGFAEGKAESIEEVMKLAGHENYEIIHHTLKPLDKVINILIHPAISGILIMIIIGGLYFELQTPGIGFPLGAAVFAALLYFAPLYLEGLATHWEVIVFVLGIIL
ncbi:MAG TPA: nodulation protein NfeD, partial [Bacteroidales bacterium]|nr:nodulation protein NfeD [Bacteroidales bacterium]